MVDASEGLGSKGLKSYHKKEFSHAAGVPYYGEKQQASGTWHGKLAAELGLQEGAAVDVEQFGRLADGQHPITKEALVKAGRKLNKETGQWEEYRRAGIDITVGASDKSISVLNAHLLMKGNTIIRDIHEAAVLKTADYLQKYVVAHGGGSNPGIPTGQWIVASFTHDSARPVDGYQAPHLHTHLVLFNMTKDAEGKWHAIEFKPLFDAQAVGNAVYNNHFAQLARQQGIAVDWKWTADHMNVTIPGYSQEFLDKNSPRSQAITEEAERRGVSGSRQRSKIAHEYRDSKLDIPREAVLAMQAKVEAEFGGQSGKIWEEAQQKKGTGLERESALNAHEVVTLAKQTLENRVAVFDERNLEKKALQQSQGYVSLEDIQANIQQRATETDEMKANGIRPEFLQVHHVHHYDHDKPEKYYTTRDLLADEQQVMLFMVDGKGRMSPMAAGVTAEQMSERYAGYFDGRGLSKEQAVAIAERLNSTDRMQGIVGGAGVGKTAGVLRPLQEVAKEHGFEVVGVAPTAKATKELKKYHIDHVMTFAKLMTGKDALLEKKGIEPAKPRLYFIDESSLASTTAIKDAMKWAAENRPQDRIIFIGDPRQHQSIEPSRAFEMLLQAGMDHSTVEGLIRPKTEQLQKVGAYLQTNSIDTAFRYLHNAKHWEDGVSRIYIHEQDAKRFNHIVGRYLLSPSDTLVISPDNDSRQMLNAMIRHEMQTRGLLKENKLALTIYRPEQNITGPEKKLSASYKTGHVIQFQKSHALTLPNGQKFQVEAGEYATVLSSIPDRKQQAVTIRLHRESANPDHDLATYDPGKGKSAKVEIYTPQQRDLAEGERIIFKRNDNERNIANGDMGTVKAILKNDNVVCELDTDDKGPRRVIIPAAELHHTDYGYVTTSYSSQGMTLRNVVVNIDTSNPHAMKLLKKELGYVAVSRATHDVRIVTDDLDKAIKLISREAENHTAHSLEEKAGFSRFAEIARQQLNRERAEEAAKTVPVQQREVPQVQRNPNPYGFGGGR